MRASDPNMERPTDLIHKFDTIPYSRNSIIFSRTPATCHFVGARV